MTRLGKGLCQGAPRAVGERTRTGARNIELRRFPVHVANQRIDAMSRCRAIIPVLVACSLLPAGGAAQGDPWAAPVRGAWGRTGPVAARGRGPAVGGGGGGG